MEITLSILLAVLGISQVTCSTKRDQQIAVGLHNQFRSIHYASPLTIDTELNHLAQAYADDLAEADPNLDVTPGTGESIGDVETGTKVSDVMKEWYYGEPVYTFSGSYEPGTARYTQMIWKGSEKMGLGVASNNNGTTWIVVHYSPPGNIEGAYDENLQPAD